MENKMMKPEIPFLKYFSRRKREDVMPQRPFFKSLRGKITWQMLLISLLPILIIGVVAYTSVGELIQSAKDGVEDSRSQLVEDVVGEQASDAAEAIAAGIDQFMLARMTEMMIWVSSPIVVNTARLGYEQAEEMGLPAAPITVIEETMRASHNIAPDPETGRWLSLSTDPAADKYLQEQMNLSGHFSDIFFTDAHGYNVAVTGETQDFVQSDEGWWLAAWQNGMNVEPVKYNPSAGTWGCDIATRIDDPDTEEPVGVLKAVLSVAPIHTIATTNAKLVRGGQVSILTTEQLLIAETSSKHDPERIMNPEVQAADSVMQGMVQAYQSSNGKGHTFDEEGVIGYARTAPEGYYETIAGFDGFHWGVIVEQSQQEAFALLGNLMTLEEDLNESQNTMSWTIVGVALLMGIVGSGVALSVSRSITGPVSSLRDAVERSRMGDSSVEIMIETEDEIGDLANAFDRMISERSVAEIALRSERDYSTGIVNQTPAIIIGLASNGSVTFINPAGELITGYSAQELVDKSWWRTFFPGEEYSQVEQLFHELNENGSDLRNYEMTLTSRNGEKRICEWNAINRYDDSGELIEVVVFGNDITERKRAETAMEQSVMYFRSLIENSSDVILLLDANRTIVYCSSSVERIQGFSTAELTGANVFDFVHPDDVTSVTEVIMDGPGYTVNKELRVRHKDGSWRYVESTLKNLLDDPSVAGIVINFHDITDRKIWETDIKEINEEIHLMLENVTSVSQAIVEGDFGKEIEITSRMPELGSALQEMTGILKNVVDQANTIASGDYDADIEPRSDKDELGLALQNMTRTLREMKRENSRQLRLAEGQANLNAVMRGEKEIPDLAKGVVGFLSKELNAQIATMYVFDVNDNKLHLAGSYAFTKRKGNPDTFELGEGLVGQTALEKELISFTDIPEDYMRIGSSLGETIPRNIVVSPFLFEGNLKGIIELGSTNEFTDDDIDFLQSTMEAIAIAVFSAQNRDQLTDLLYRSQELAEQLQAQEEELRVANEELIQKTQELEESEKDLKSQQEELQAANEELEEKTQRLQVSEEQLKAQQQELQATNEELEEKTISLQHQKEEITRNNWDLEEARQELELRAEDLKLASRYKSEFLANMSHELRTPLNSLLILANDLASNRTENLSEDQVESAQIIHKSGQDLLALINDILDLSKIEAGKMPVNVETILLPDIANSITTNFKHVVAGKGLELEINLSENLPETIRTDQQRLLQVIKNLMSNAIKFTDTGGITVDFSRPGPDANLSNSGLDPQKGVAIAVIDTGAGIPSEKQGEIFEAFQQADGSTSRQYGGTGLGLSISREIARLLGGEIQLESEEGKGSKFTLYIIDEMDPEVEITRDVEKAVSSVKDEKKPAVAKVDNPKRKPAPSIEDDRNSLTEDDKVILVVEDDLNFAKTLAKLCRERDFKCIHAGDGETGLELAEKYMPIAIVLDIKLPGLDGWGVLEMLKDNVATRHIPVHMMSAAEETIDAYRKGVIGYLTKPVDLDQIDNAFTRIEGLISKDVKDLLLVESDVDLRENIIELIGNGDVETRAINSGEQAIQELKSKTYDCMIMDVNLPDMSGFDVLKALNEMDDISVPPVVVYTGRELTPDEELKLQVHAGSIMVKGVKSEERLLDETALFLHRVVGNLPESKKRMITRLHEKDSIFEGKKVLLVDDDMRNVFALSKVLEEKGLEINKAANGQKALDVLESDPEIDMVLMDIMMPVMDGYEAIQHIREQERFAELPIVAVTANAMVDDREKCISAGANDYIPKPVDTDRLLSLMRVWLYE